MNTEQIVSWITVENYSKLNEYFFFIFCVLLLPLVVGFVLTFISPFKKNQSYQNVKVNKNVWHLIFWLLIIPPLLYLALLKTGLHGFFDLYHEGEMLVPAQMYLQGALPYRDFYLQHGLIRNFLMPLLAMNLYGESVEAVRKLFYLVEPFSYVFLYFIGLFIFRGGFFVRAVSALVPVLFCSSFHYWIGLRQGLMLLSLNFLLLSIKSLHRDRNADASFLLAGLSSSFCFWFSIDYGLYCFFASLVAILFLKLLPNIQFNLKKAYVAYSFGAFLVSFPILLWFASKGLLIDFYENTYQQIFYQSTVWGYAFPNIDFNSSQIIRMYCSVAILSIVSSFLCWRFFFSRFFFSRFFSRDKTTGNNALTPKLSMLLTVFIFAVFCFRTALGRSDYGHWIDGSTLIFLLLFVPFNWVLFGQNVNTKKKVVFLFLLLPLTYFLSIEHEVYSSIQKRISKYGVAKKAPIKEPLERLGHIFIPEAQAKTLTNVVKYINANTDNDYIYDFANQAGYYFLTNTKSPTKYFQVSYAATPEMQREVVRSLERYQPRIVIESTGTAFDAIDGISSKRRHSIISQYIQQHYEFAITFDSTTLLKRKL